MKKLIVSICTAFCLMAAPLAAFEWGGLFSNDSGISTPDFKSITFQQSDGISLWAKSPLGENTGLYFSSEILYKFNLQVEGGKPSIAHIADLPLLKVSGDVNAGAGILSLTAGRFFYVDSSSAVISQVVDGLSIAYALPVVKVGVFAGYTGLLNALNTPMAVSPKKENKVYNMAYPYLPAGLTVEFPSLAGNQSLEFDGYFMLDLGTNKAAEKQNMLYANAVLSGPIANAVYYSAGTTFGFVNFKDLMNYSSLSVMIFPSQTVSVSMGASFGSGEQGPFKDFVSLSTTSITAASKITPKLALSFTSGNLYLGLNGDFVLAYEESKYKPSNTDIGAEFLYNIFSDLQAGFSLNATIDLTEAKANDYGAKLNISLAF